MRRGALRGTIKVWKRVSACHVYLSIFSCLMLLKGNFLKILPWSDGTLPPPPSPTPPYPKPAE